MKKYIAVVLTALLLVSGGAGAKAVDLKSVVSWDPLMGGMFLAGASQADSLHRYFGYRALFSEIGLELTDEVMDEFITACIDKSGTMLLALAKVAVLEGKGDMIAAMWVGIVNEAACNSLYKSIIAEAQE